MSTPGTFSFEVPVAVTFAGEANAIAAPLRAVAALALEDVRFDRAASLPMPGSLHVMRRLAEQRRSHPQARLTLFGHAELDHDEATAREVADRRVRAVYALLVRDVSAWEQLYASPVGWDDWRVRAIPYMLETLGFETGGLAEPDDAGIERALRSFQASRELAVTGRANPETRARLFADYMDAVCQDDHGVPYRLDPGDFLGRGRDPGGKVDRQSCGRWNPLVVLSKASKKDFSQRKRSHGLLYAESVNRRVSLFLVSDEAEVVESRWPCPRVGEDGAACEKRLWSNGRARIESTDLDRHQVESADTFGCRFYERLVLGAKFEPSVSFLGVTRVAWSKSSIWPVRNSAWPAATPPTDRLSPDAIVDLIVETSGMPDGVGVTIEIRHAVTDEVVDKLDGLVLRSGRAIDPATGELPTWTCDGSMDPWRVWDQPHFYFRASVDGCPVAHSSRASTDRDPCLRVVPIHALAADAMADAGASSLQVVNDVYEIGDLLRQDSSRETSSTIFDQEKVSLELWGSVIRSSYAYYHSSHGTVACPKDGKQFHIDWGTFLPTVCRGEGQHPESEGLSCIYLGKTTITGRRIGDQELVPSVPRYLAFFSCCLVAYEASFCDALLARGTQNVIAFRRVVYESDARAMARQFYRRWIHVHRGDPAMISAAYIAVAAPYHDQLMPHLFGTARNIRDLGTPDDAAVADALGVFA